MKRNELKRLSRRQLLELMLEQSQRIDELEQQLEAAHKELHNRWLITEEAGSIAEASLRLNKVFEAAQAAADQYLLNVRRLSGEGDNE